MSEEQIERVAKAINGPHDATHIGDERLRDLQDYRWDKQTTNPEQRQRITQARAAISAMQPVTVAEAASLDDRMKAAGMIPLSELLKSNGPLERWERHAGMKSFTDFVDWVHRKQRDYMEMRMQYELGDKNKGDDLFEWVFAHAAVFNSVATQLRALAESET